MYESHFELSKKVEINFQVPSEQKTRLSGYGVELAIKSQEYKAKDDTKIEGDHNILLYI
jgi:hypothetical protein